MIANSIFTKKTQVLLFVLLCLFARQHSYATAWTTSTTGAINTLSNWTNGSGSPSSFTTPGDTWTVAHAMTMAASVTWTLGTASSAAVTLTFGSGGSLAVSSAGGTPTINVYGDLVFSAGSYSPAGAGTNHTVNVYGNTTMSGGSISIGGAGATLNLNCNGAYTMTSGSIVMGGSSPNLILTTHGNYTMTGGTLSTSSAGGTLRVNVNGNYLMSGGTTSAGGASATIALYVYGNYASTGTSAMTSTGAGTTSEVHLALPTASGLMLAHNTSSGSWSGTNVYVDSACAAELDSNFSTNTGSSAYGLTVKGKMICPAADTVKGTRMFTLARLATLEVRHTSGINGAIATSGTMSFDSTASYIFSGTSAQLTGTYLPATLVTPSEIVISNSAGVTLSHSVSSTGSLNFTSGILTTTASYTITLPGAASAVTGAGASSYVYGTLIKTITGLTTVNYEVGNTDYAPMNLTLSSAGTGGSIGVNCKPGLHPSVGSSGLLTSNMVNHYWTITNYSAAGPATIFPLATYNYADIIGGTNTAFLTQKYSGSSWLGSSLATTNTVSPYTSAPNAGVSLSSLAGDYIFGNYFCGTGAITGPTTVCVGSAITLADTTAGGTWSSSATSIATISTGGIVTGLTVGTATISYATSGCTVTLAITVNDVPTVAPITGTDSVCPKYTVTLSDATGGGVWSSTNAAIATVSATGVVYGIAPGYDTIKYTATNGCGSGSAQLRVKVRTSSICKVGVDILANSGDGEMNIAPNPNNGTFAINLLSQQNEELSVLITNVVGRKVMEFDMRSNATREVKLDQPAGMYIIAVSGRSGKMYFGKVTIE